MSIKNIKIENTIRKKNFKNIGILILFLMRSGPKVLLNTVPGNEPIAKDAKRIPAIFLSNDRNINDLETKFANIIEN